MSEGGNMSLITIILIGLLIFYMSRINYRKIYLSLKIPGPFPLPFIGSALYFFNKSPAEIWNIVARLAAEYGDVVSFWTGPELQILLSDPRDIQIVLTSTKLIDKSEAYRFFKPWLNEGLLISAGSKWQQRRKIITPTFHFNNLQEYVKIFDRQSSVFIEMLSKYKTTDKVELLPLFALYTLDVTGEAAMGIELKSQRNPRLEYVKAIRTISHIIISRVVSSFNRFDIFFRFSAMYKQQTDALKVVNGLTDRVIQERRQKLMAQSSDANVQESSKTKTFLDTLLQGSIYGEPFSNLDIREEVNTLMFAGHDTSSSALSFVFYSMARYPEIQQKCFQEIRSVLGDDRSKSVSFNELNNLRYLDLVIKETMRMYPNVPIMGRCLAEELTIGNYTFPKGASLAFSPVILGRNPKLFQDPLEFRPERFLEDITTDKFTYSFLPFSAGPRNCIGQKFAILEMKAVASKVLNNFEISLADDSLSDPELVGNLITTTVDPINYHIKPRMY